MRTFSPGEANALLPTISGLVAELLRVRREAAIARLELEATKREPASAGLRESALARDVGALQERVIALIEKIHAAGCVVKDVDLGLVDFPCEVSDETINLCWKYGEPSIQYWHRMEEGFASRKPLSD